MSAGRVTDEFGSGLLIDGRFRVAEDRVDGGYAGVHLSTGRPVRLRIAAGDSPEMMRLKRKLPAVVALDHPALVPVLDVGLDERGLYLVEPRIDGEPLAALVGEAQPADRVADIVRQLARVLADAHGRGIAHGALRPDCVWLQQTLGRSDYVRLAGMGLGSTPFVEDAGPWAAPELTEGVPPDARADLYALGLIGRALLGGLSADEAASGALPGAPPALVEVLDALVRRSPGQRPPSAVAVLGPLERATQMSTAGSAGGARAMSDTIISTGPLAPVDPAARARVEAAAAALESSRRPAAPSQIETTVDIERLDLDRLDLAGARRSRMVWAAVVGLLLAIIGYLLLRGPAPGEEAVEAATRGEASESAAVQVGEPAPAVLAEPAAAPAVDAAVEVDAAVDAAVEIDAAPEPEGSMFEVEPARPAKPTRRRRATRPKTGTALDAVPPRPRPVDAPSAPAKPAAPGDSDADPRAYEKL